MGPFIIIALIILLFLIVISVFAYPFICANIAIACKRFNGIATGFLLLLTLAFYIFACTTLEDSFDNWCYSVYAGIVLTPIFLFFCTGLEEPGRWLESGEKAQHNKITIPLLTFLTSSLFTIEGVLRMAHSYSIHKMLNFGWGTYEADIYWHYYDEFQYAGSLLFCVSLLSALVIGVSSFSTYKAYRHNLVVETEKKSRIEREVNEVTRSLKADSDFLMSFAPQKVNEAILYYNSFCKKIIAALESSDEKTSLSYEFRAFNNIETTYKVLLLSNKNRSFYFYPMGIVLRDSNDAYKYIPNGSDTVSVSIIKKNRKDALPSDIRPIRQYWQHSCLDGSPDLRYKYNPKTYIYEYGFLRIAELILHVFRLNAGKDAVSAYKEMYSFISMIKEQKHHEEMNAISEVKVVTSNIISENKVIIPKAEQPEDVKTTAKPITIETPKTLEDCFSAIIHKHGMDIIKENNLVSIISSYKEVDISEYKDVLNGMVSEKFLCQFIEPDKQNDFALYNLSSSFARQKKLNAQKSVFITQALVNAIKKSKV